MALKTMMTFVLCGASALSVAAFAQDSTGQTQGSTSGSMSSSAGSNKDKTFLMTAAEGSLAEIQTGQLAAQKATSPDVKSFGQKMVDDHTTLNSQMKPIADKMSVAIPTTLNAKHQAIYDKLNTLSGPEFDKAYIKAMVADHHKDLKEFTAEMKSTKDPDLKAAVTQGRDVIQQHTTMVEQLQKSNGTMAGMNHSGSASSTPMQ